MQNTLRLPLTFDPTPLQAELGLIAADEWVPHFNQGYYEGEWSVAPFRSIGGSLKQIYPDPTKLDQYTDTPLRTRCPAFNATLAAFECPLQAARLLKLAAGAHIREHRDYNLAYEDGEIRLHIPILTNPSVEFVLAGETMAMQPGEVWYLNFNLPHRVANRGTTDRIHLVLDCVLNDWLKNLLALALQQ